MSQKLRFIDHNKSAFFATVKQRVDLYFKERNLSKHANWLMYFKSVFFLGSLFLLYGLIISNHFSPGVMLVFAMLLGATMAFIGFNVCHDAIHGGYSSNPTVNRIMGYFFNLIGANAYVWSITHNVVHHTYTNIPGHDEDLDIAPGLIRVDLAEERRPIQRYQQFYSFLLYGFASLSWVFRKDYVKFFKPVLGNIDNRNKTFRDYFELFFFKAVYYFLFIVLPLIVITKVTWWQFILGFVAMHLVEGLVLGLVFQLAHLVEGTDLYETNPEGDIEEGWAVHQMKTTANFATHNLLASFLCGGLNQQIEHHLFPKVCHVHYPQIAYIVRETAKEFGVPYIENKTFFGALASHYRVLKYLGREPQIKVARPEVQLVSL